MSDTRETALAARVAELEAENAKLGQALADAANEINVAGPVAHRIRVLKDYHAEQCAALAASPAPTLAPDDVLTLVQREIEKHLYTNTKNGNRQAMLNIVERVRAAMRARETAPEEGT